MQGWSSQDAAQIGLSVGCRISRSEVEHLTAEDAQHQWQQCLAMLEVLQEDSTVSTDGSD